MSTNTITAIRATALPNSRGTETISVTVESDLHTGSFALPDGASTGSREVHVKEAHEALRILEETVSPALLGFDITDQKGIDAKLHELDGTPLFDNIGGNVALGVSVASLKTAASVLAIPTWEYVQNMCMLQKQGGAPRLFVNLINGGKHATFGSPIQEHQIIPDTDDVALAYETASRVQLALEELVTLRYGKDQIGIGDEGGFMVPTTSVFEPFELLEEAIAKAMVQIPVYIGADIAASSFYDNGFYKLQDGPLSSQELLLFYIKLHNRFPLLRMVEDPFFESDFDAYALYRKEHTEVLVIGDDLTTTNEASLKEAVSKEAINGIIIKPNQIGTVSDTLATMTLAYQEKVSCIVSHRSGETHDDFIADLAFGTGSFGLKAGAPRASERDAKYQRLIHIQKTHHG